MWAAQHCSMLFSSGQNRLCVFCCVHEIIALYIYNNCSTVQRKLYIFFERASSEFRECSSEKRVSTRCETQYRGLSLDYHKLLLEKPSRNRASRIWIHSRSYAIHLVIRKTTCTFKICAWVNSLSNVNILEENLFILFSIFKCKNMTILQNTKYLVKAKRDFIFTSVVYTRDG